MRNNILRPCRAHFKDLLVCIQSLAKLLDRARRTSGTIMSPSVRDFVMLSRFGIQAATRQLDHSFHFEIRHSTYSHIAEGF